MTGGESTYKESFSFTTKINGNDVTIAGEQTFKENDDQLGHYLVEYCDNAGRDGYRYKTGDLDFVVNSIKLR